MCRCVHLLTFNTFNIYVYIFETSTSVYMSCNRSNHAFPFCIGVVFTYHDDENDVHPGRQWAPHAVEHCIKLEDKFLRVVT